MQGAYGRLLNMKRLKSGAATPAGVPAGVKAAGGGPAWYWPSGKGDSNFVTEEPTVFPEYYVGASVTVGQTGTATKLGAKVRNAAGTTKNCKIYLFSSADALLTSGTTTIPAATTAWIEATISQAVTNGTTYKVLFSCDDGAHEMYDYFDTLAAPTWYGLYSTTDYPSNPASITEDPDDSVRGVKIYVE